VIPQVGAIIEPCAVMAAVLTSCNEMAAPD
jgi:hypothetical protein